MAFQIKDDLFDYGEDRIGKPTGIDIKEQKMTLPLIYALNQAEPADRKWLINSVKNYNKNRRRVKEVIAYVKASGGLEYAESKMMEFKNEALDILASYPRSDYREALELMVNYVVDRRQ
jgi:octaprenyl-diphosphate synthase